MRPEFGLSAAVSASVSPGGNVWVPSSLLVRARVRREQQCRDLLRARQRELQLQAYAEETVIRILEELSEGRLLCSDPFTSLGALESDVALPRPSRKNPAHLTVAAEYRPTSAGRLQSRLARWAAEDPKLLQALQERIEAGLTAAGHMPFFQVHLVQRFVGAGERGYHVTTRVQLLVGLFQREPRRLPPIPS